MTMRGALSSIPRWSASLDSARNAGCAASLICKSYNHQSDAQKELTSEPYAVTSTHLGPCRSAAHTCSEDKLIYGDIAVRPRLTARVRDRFAASECIKRENSKMENPVPGEPCLFMKALSSLELLQIDTTVPTFCSSTDDPVSLTKTRMTGSVLSKAIMPGLACARIAIICDAIRNGEITSWRR
jgi:hypothetical protein